MTPQPYFNEKGEVVSFAELMKLEKIDERTFRSTVRAYSPTGGENGTYGGHVYSQAVWAAAQTVQPGFLLHNVTGWFTLGGIPSEHFVYTVHRIRDGGNYCTRTVTVTQIAERGTSFTCTCSFKRPEPSPFEYQELVDLKARFREVLAGKGPFDHPEAPSVDSIRYVDEATLSLPVANVVSQFSRRNFTQEPKASQSPARPSPPQSDDDSLQQATTSNRPASAHHVFA
jgi:acyl-CoA thioesterase II